MGGKEREACGRCAMSSVVDTAMESEEGEGPSRDPFDGERIEVSEGEARTVSPAAWLEGVKTRLDEVATRLTYGR